MSVELGETAGEKVVLVATDFSPFSDAAIAKAARLPVSRDAHLLIVHVLQLSPYEQAREVWRERARAMLDDASRRCQEAVRGRKRKPSRVSTLLLEGKPADQIARRIKTLRPALVVLGRHGESNFSDLFIGSTAEKVLRRCGEPVLIVSSLAQEPYQHVVIAADLEGASGDIGAVVAQLVERGAAVDAIHVVDVPYRGVLRASGESQETIDRLEATIVREAERPLSEERRRLAAKGLRVDSFIEKGDVRATILAAVKSRHADLLCVGSRRRSGMESALMGSVAEGLIRHSPVDVLVARGT